jgi:arylsulfatase A-like enzyme
VLLLLAASLLTAGCAGGPAEPSLLLVVTQGVRPDHISAYGYARQTTPRLEALALEGVAFERAYSSTPHAVPALASLLTGRFPPEHGLLLSPTLNPEITTLAEALKSAGFATHVITSYLPLREETGLLEGFDGIEVVDPATDGPLDGGAASVTERALEWLREERDGESPFFLLLVYSSPTLPFDPPEPYRTQFTGAWMNEEALDQASALWLPLARRINSGEINLGTGDVEVLKALYDGELAYLDSKIGELFTAMTEDGILDETLVVVTSDSGEVLGENSRISDESSLSESGLRVPLIMRHPDLAPAGTRIQDIFQDVDLLPTLCDLLGVSPPGSISSMAANRAPLDGGGRRSNAVSVAIRQVSTRVLDLSMSIRDERYRYTLDPQGPGSLFDLQGSDAGENILDSSPEVARRMHAQLSEWNDRLGPLPGGAAP